MELHSSLPAPQPPSWQDAPRLGLAQCWLPASLHALILACFARLFGRLEQLLHLWQTAGFPPPAVRAPSDIPAPRSTTAHRAPAAHTSRHSSARSNGRPAQATLLHARRSQIAAPWTAQPVQALRTAIAPHPCPHRARAPPRIAPGFFAKPIPLLRNCG